MKPSDCYCDEDQGDGYTYDDEFGPCDPCLQQIADDCVGPRLTDRFGLGYLLGCDYCIAQAFCTRKEDS